MQTIKSLLRGALFIFAFSTVCAALGVVVGDVSRRHTDVTPIRITVDLGGSMLDYIKSYSASRVDHKAFIIDGLCVSACTMITGELPNIDVCVTPYAKLGFHSAFITTPAGRAFSAEGTDLLWRIYPDKIKELLKKHGWAGPYIDQPTIIWIEGTELQQIYKLCPQN